MRPPVGRPLVYKSTSEEMRRDYRRTLLELFRLDGTKHPADAVPGVVSRWGDTLHSQKKSASAPAVSFKLPMVRSFFEYLRAAVVVTLNPAVTRLVPPPELTCQPAGRALTVKEVRHLLAGLDREKPEGATTR